MVAVMAVAVLLVVGWLVFKPGHKDTASTQTTGAVSVSTGQPTGSATGATTTASIETGDFKYAVPTGWVQIKKEALDQAAATSGIAHISALTATFKISIDPSTPKDDSSTLSIIKKNAPNFALLASTDTKVDGHTGRRFTYSFTDASGKNKVRQQLNVITYKGRTFFLLFSAVDGDFDKQTGDFASILASFKFK